MEMETLELADHVLFYFKTETSKGSLGRPGQEFQRPYFKEKGIDMGMLNHGLQFLISDGLVEVYGNAKELHRLTAKGHDVISEGGLRAKKQAERTEKLTDSEDKKLQRLVNQSSLRTNESVISTNESVKKTNETIIDLSQSTKDTNKSVQDTNTATQDLAKATKRNFRFQIFNGAITLVVAIGTLVVAGLAYHQKDVSGEVRILQQDIQQLKERLDSVQSQKSIMPIQDSIQTDTVSKGK
jgi:hypothetical protein